MNTVTVTATKWKLGWELELDSGGVTQVRSLANAERQTRDYLDTVDPEVDHTLWDVTVIPDIGPVFAEALDAKAATEAARVATVTAAQRLRDATRGLLSEGLTVTETAAVLGVTKGRVSQLTATSQ